MYDLVVFLSGKLMQLNFTKDVLKKMSNDDDTVERISAVINLAGLPGSGKTTLISRLLGRKFEPDRPSTGICNTTLAVDLHPAQLYWVKILYGNILNITSQFKISCMTIFLAMFLNLTQLLLVM